MVIMIHRRDLLRFGLIVLAILAVSAPAAADGTLDITVEDENSTAVDDALVTINDGSFEDEDRTDSSGTVRFGGLDAGIYRVTIEKEDFHTREVSVSVEDDTETSKTVYIQKKDLRGEVTIHTETEAGDDLPDVSVRLASDETGYDKEKETSGGGNVIFDEVPVGEYQAYLERDGFTSREITVNVYDGKTSEYDVVMSESELKGRALQITELTLPSQVRPGDTATAEVTVTNNKNETARGVRVELEAFDQSTETTRFSLSPDETETRTIDIDVPSDAIEDESVRVTARDYENSHTITTTLQLTSFRASMRLEPQTAAVGEAVYVSGRITDQSGGAGGVVANLYLNDAFIAGLTTDETGRYRTYIRPDSAGIQRVTFQNSNLRVSKQLRVQPRIEVTEFAIPSPVNQTEDASACAQVTVSSESYVTSTLAFNGREVAHNVSQLSDRRICLPIPTDAPGEYAITFRAETRDGSDSASGTINIAEVETVSNPGISINASGSFAMDKGQRRFLIADLTNPRPEAYNVTIRLSDLPAELAPTTAEDIMLASNSTTTVNMTIAGNRSGSYVGSVDVDYRNETILSQDLKVDVRGSVAATFDELMDRVGQYGGRAVTLVRNNTEYAAAAVLIIAFLILIRRRLGSKMAGPLEPKNA